jgi:hypothetical protein
MLKPNGPSSPSTVKNYFATTNYFYKRKYPELTHYFLLTYIYSFLIALIFYLCQVINMSHFDPIDPNV